MSAPTKDADSLVGLRSRFRGALVTSEHEDYELARRVFNGMIDRRPALIACCTGVADILEALRFAREEGLVVAVRGGGHGVSGDAVVDDGVVIDLSPMKGIQIDPEARLARVQAGVKWGELDRETQAFGLAVTGGRMSGTGVAGLTLGGGSGWIERRFGLTSDNLISADMVLADGRFLRVSEEEHPDLFWGLKGGGGNFGIVTSFEFRLHPVGPTVLGGMLLFPGERAEEILRAYAGFMADAPDEVGGACGLMTAPPEEFVPEELRGAQAAALIVSYVGPVEEGERVIAPLRELGPAVDLVGPMPYTALQQLIDPGNPSGMQNYWEGRVPRRAVGGGDRDARLLRAKAPLTPHRDPHAPHGRGARPPRPRELPPGAAARLELELPHPLALAGPRRLGARDRLDVRDPRPRSSRSPATASTSTSRARPRRTRSAPPSARRTTSGS